MLYNTHFRGDVLWWLLADLRTNRWAGGRAADWANPDWPMYDMGGYGSGARFLLVDSHREEQRRPRALGARARGAHPDPAPARDPRFSKRSVYQDAVSRGLRRDRRTVAPSTARR